ncbi:MAG: flagellar hook-length control protein FliK [Bryobacterales bacterium]|nr:flagellar hook-length control protein FliK [Bryobacterales bacterium]
MTTTLTPDGNGTPAQPTALSETQPSPDPARVSLEGALPSLEPERKDLPAETRNFRIPLEPLGAGPVEIRLAQSASGVQVRVHAAHGETRQVLQDNLSELVGSLHTQGLQTRQVSLPADATVPLPADATEAVRNARQLSEPVSQERLSPDYLQTAPASPDQTSYDSHPDRQNQSWREANKKRKGQSKPNPAAPKEVSWLLSRV